MRRFQQTYHALGSTTIITLVTRKNESYASELLQTIRQQINQFEQRFSRFLPDSELTLFNLAAGQKTQISKPFHQLLQVAKSYNQQTDGLYNPFILPALQKAGYVGSWPNPKIKAHSPDFSEATVFTGNKLIIGNTWAQIPQGSALDSGGIGKGFLLDQLVHFIGKYSDVSGFWFSLGGDIACGGFNLNDQPWSVGVAQANQEDAAITSVVNVSGEPLAIATSGVTKRRGINHGTTWHHIIDPATNKPSKTEIITATVTAKSGVSADIYAKCIVISGSAAAKAYQAQGNITGYVLQTESGEHTIELEGVS